MDSPLKKPMTISRECLSCKKSLGNQSYQLVKYLKRELQGWLNTAYSNANLGPVMTIPARSRNKA